MKVLIVNPPWIYRKNKETFAGFRNGSRWPTCYPVPSASSHLSQAYKLLKEGRAGEILKKIIMRYKVRKQLHVPLYGFSGYMPYPVFMGYATGFLRSKGIEAVFYDAAAQRHDYNVFFKTVDKFRPDMIIQETSTASFDIDLDIARRLHMKYEVCLVGPHATTYAEKVIALPYVDYVLKGSYEYSALKMVKARLKGVYDYDVADINDLPYPYRDNAIAGHYRDYTCLKKLAFPQLWLYASRGCAFSCDFCLWVHVMFNNRLSLRDPEKVVEEAEEMARMYGFRHVYFDDDCWNIGPEERLFKIADGMKKIGLPWTINARLDLSTKETFRYFIDRGCTGLRVGVESFSQRLLNIIHKGSTIEDILDKIKCLENTGVDLYLLFMHYIPGETDLDREEQRGRIGRLGHRFQNPPCIPYPGTPYYKKIIEAGFDLEKVKCSKFDAGNIGSDLLWMIKEYSKKVSG